MTYTHISADKQSKLKPGITRRQLLRSSVLGVALTTLPIPLFAQQPAITHRNLRGNLNLVSGAGANIVTLDSPEGLLMVDGGLPEFSNELLATVQSLSATGQIHTLINTNWRHEHTGINELVNPILTDIIAHENTLLWMTNEFTVDWENRHYQPRPDHALPTRTFYEQIAFQSGAERVELGILPRAHTDGDIYVYFRQANVLVVSDLLAVSDWPVIDYNTGGWIGGFIDASEALLAMSDADTLIIPAQGDPQNRSAIVDQLDMCRDIMGKVEIAYSEAMSFEEFLATEPAAPWLEGKSDPGLFLLQAWKGLWGHIRYTQDVYFV